MGGYSLQPISGIEARMHRAETRKQGHFADLVEPALWFYTKTLNKANEYWLNMIQGKRGFISYLEEAFNKEPS
jgi:hypothetical protein